MFQTFMNRFGKPYRGRFRGHSMLRRYLQDTRATDKQRLENSLNELPDIVSRALFVSKLTPYERRLLGI